MGRRGRRRDSGGGSPVEAPPAAIAPPPAEAASSRASRTEAKNAAARARLVPLSEGERPRAVTVAFFVVLLQAALNVAAYVAGVQLAAGEPAPLMPLLAYTFILLVTAYGLWRARYWAVLGTQALLVLTILVLSLILIVINSVLEAAVAVVLIAGAGVLFWFLIRAMARIQMPGR